MDFQQYRKSFTSASSEKSKYAYYYTLGIEALLKEFENWMRYTKDYSEKTTIHGKIRKVRKFFKDTDLQITDVTKELRETYKAYLIEQMRQGIYKRNYVASILTELNVFFCSFLGKDDLRVPTIEKEEIAFDRYTREDIDALIKAVENRDGISTKKRILDKALILTLWNELPRVSELCSLKLEHIQEVSRKVKFQSRKRQNVPPHLRYPFATQEFLDTWDEYKAYRDSDDWGDDAPAFVQNNKNGMPVGQDYVRKMLKEYASLAGIKKKIYPHLIRKSAGTELCIQKPKFAQIQLGHKNIKTTLTNYTGPNDNDKQNIDAILNPRGQKTTDEIVKGLSQRFVNGDIPEHEYLFAIRSIKNTQTRHSIAKNDVAFQ